MGNQKERELLLCAPVPGQVSPAARCPALGRSPTAGRCREGAVPPSRAALPARWGAEEASERPWERGCRGLQAWHSSAPQAIAAVPRVFAADGSNLKQPRRALLSAPSLWEHLVRPPLNILTPGFGAKLGLATHKVGSSWRYGPAAGTAAPGGAARLPLFKE